MPIGQDNPKQEMQFQVCGLEGASEPNNHWVTR